MSIVAITTNNIVLDYFHISRSYQEQYGEDTVVLYMVGGFYEIYSLKHAKTHEISNITPISKVTEICNLNIANKQSTIGENKNALADIPHLPILRTCSSMTEWTKMFPPSHVVMAGVRDYAVEKYIEKLTESGFTVVVFDQEKYQHPTTKKEIIQRKLQSIYSPGTYISSTTTAVTTNTRNNIMCIWIEKYRQKVVCGIANANIVSGEIFLFEYESSLPLQNTSFDELERILCTHTPTELICITNMEQHETELALSYSGANLLSTKLHIISSLTTSTKIINCGKQTYQQSCLQLLAKPNTNSNVYETCCEFHSHPMATQAICYLLDFIQEHNKNLVRKLQFPIFHHHSNRVTLANRTLRQLHIVTTTNGGHGHLASVETFLNKCSTPMGKRLLKNELLHPTIDSIWLNREYERIHQIHQLFEHDKVIQLRRNLNCNVRDVEKFCRQIVTKKLNPNSLYALYESIQCFSQRMHQEVFETVFIEETDQYQYSKDFLKFMEEHFHIPLLIHAGVSQVSDENQPLTDSSSHMNHPQSFITRGVCKELDDILLEQNRLNHSLNSIHTFFETTFLFENSIKIHETEKCGISLQLTKKRAATLRTKLAEFGSPTLCITPFHELKDNVTNDQDETIEFRKGDVKINSISSSSDEISFPKLSEITQTILKNKERIKILTNNAYQDILQEMENSLYDTIIHIGRQIAEYDVILNKAYISKENNYCRPQIITDEHSSARVVANSLRHPLIEHIQMNETYVANDVCLNQEGILLTGYNGIGKTSLIRALGISIIMAQSGFYVPCSEFILHPYQAIYCNIEKNDNLFKNMSTFQLEMSELRLIMRQADSNSLVLGDELMNSTELASGLSIMISALTTLCEKKVAFVIATHLNQLADYEEICCLQNLRMKHMSVCYDQEQQKLVYNRILKDGFGSKSYGLEVARSLLLEPSFLEKAFSLRNKYFPEESGVLSLKTSKYSSKKLRGICENCKCQYGTEVHHKLEQHEADTLGFIGHVHKNHPANLMNVCETCHRNFHANSV
jgi:DNA mismatch repair protein MutS